jgi:hypothetical protein
MNTMPQIQPGARHADPDAERRKRRCDDDGERLAAAQNETNHWIGFHEVHFSGLMTV